MNTGIEIKNDGTLKEIDSQLDRLRIKYGILTGDNGQEKVPDQETETTVGIRPISSKAFSSMSQADILYSLTKHQISNNTGNIKKIHRDWEKVCGSIEEVKYKKVETPGVIPRTLSNVESILKRVSQEEQPRIDKILDSAHGNLDESQKLLQKINIIMGDSDKEGLLHALKKYDLLFKIGLGLAGFSILITIVLIPWVLLRIIFFGL